MKKKHNEKITEADIKIAKNPEGALWIRAKENLEADIKTQENSLKISKAFLEKANEMIAKEND